MKTSHHPKFGYPQIGNQKPGIGSVSGFTFVEMSIVIAILAILFGSAASVLGNFMGNQALKTGGSTLVQTLREAHTRAMASEQDSSWGVYFDSVSEPDRFVLFKGNSYVQRDPSFDQATFLNPGVGFGPLLLNGAGDEVLFSKRSGATDQYGFFTLAHREQNFTVRINPLGFTDYDY